MKKLNLILVIAISAATLVACGEGSIGTATKQTGALLGTLPVPNIASGINFTYDGGQVADGKFYLTDRNNKGVDVYDTATLLFIGTAQGIGALAFTGQAFNPDGSANNDQTGPNSLQKIPGTNKLYVTDVNSVKVVDTNSLQVVKVIPIPGPTGLTGNRTDGSCLDAEHHIFMGMNSTDSFITFINTDTDTIIARYDYDQAINPQGLEVCAYVPSLQKFFVNNDGNDINLNGQLDSFSLASVQAAKPVLDTPIPLADCNPNGLAVGPNNEAVIACDTSGQGVAGEGKPLITMIADLANRKVAYTIPFGGSDLASYDPVTKRYFLGSRNWQAGGKVVMSLPKNPSLGIIDAVTHKALTPVPAGKGAHTAVVDSSKAYVFVPFTPTSGSADFANGGIAVYSTN